MGRHGGLVVKNGDHHAGGPGSIPGYCLNGNRLPHYYKKALLVLSPSQLTLTESRLKPVVAVCELGVYIISYIMI